MPNVVNITVTSTNRSQAGFNEAGKGLTGLKLIAIQAGEEIAKAAIKFGVESVKMAMDFDAQMTRLTTQAGVAKDQLGVLSRGVLDLAGQVGQSPQSLAEALFHVESNFASLGISSQKALSLVKIAAEGASVGGADLVDVTNALTAAVASGIPGVQDFSKAMGILNATVGAGDMTMQDLANALSSGVLAVVKGYGLTITDVSAALATFGDNNIRGKVAATDLRTAVQALAVPTKDGKAQLIAWGQASNQLATDMQQHGLLYALEHLQQLFKQNGISATQQGQIITDMFGKKAGSGVAILLGQMDRLKSKYPDLQKGANQFGNAWATTNETVKQKWNDMVSYMQSRMIDLGNWMINKGNDLVPKIDKQIPTIKKYLDDIERIFREVFAKLGPAFHSSWESIVKDTKGLVAEFKKDWPEIRVLIGAVAIIIGTLVGAVLTLIDWFMKANRLIVLAWKTIVDAVLIGAKDIVDGAAYAFGWVPGLGPELKKAQKNLDNFVEHTNDALRSIPRNITVTVDANMTGNLQSVYNQQVPYAARHAIGGIASGLTMVGERGVELVDLPVGSHVIPNGSVGGALAAGGSGRPARIESVFTFGGSVDTAFAALFMKLLRGGQIVIRQRYVTT